MIFILLSCHFLEKQYVFKGQNWKYMVAVNKSSCPPLNYKLAGENYGMSLSSAGIITWSPPKVKVYKFKINVKDKCGLNAFKQYTVDVRDCFCKRSNGRICKSKNLFQPEDGNICTCVDGCKGARFD